MSGGQHGVRVWQRASESFEHQVGEVHTRCERKDLTYLEYHLYCLVHLLFVVGLAFTSCGGEKRELVLKVGGLGTRLVGIEY
jgi:hypothetical protein